MTNLVNKFTNKWRIGEKIGFGFGLIGSLFLLVIWQYHTILNKSLNDYQQLIDIDGANKDAIINIELQLLNARQAEKNFLLNHQTSSSGLISVHINKALVFVNQLPEQQAALFKNELGNYLNHFDLVNAAWIKKGLNENSGLQGSFRNAVHALEDMASGLQYDKIHINILQLRRREKDYLLRGDKKYVDLSMNLIQIIQKQVEGSHFISKDKLKFINLLTNYKNDFTALIEQNKLINERQKEMEIVAKDVTNLVNKNVVFYNSKMLEITQNIKTTSTERVQSMLWLVFIAFLLGIYFAAIITLGIVRPLRKMAIILEELTHTEKVTKMPYQADGRDEVNAMAGSLNLLSEHRKGFIDWWKSSMGESDACSKLQNKLEDLLTVHTNSEKTTEVINNIKTELFSAQANKKALLEEEHIKIDKNNEGIIKQSCKLVHISLPRDEIENISKAITHKASLVKISLEMLTH